MLAIKLVQISTLNFQFKVTEVYVCMTLKRERCGKYLEFGVKSKRKKVKQTLFVSCDGESEG